MDGNGTSALERSLLLHLLEHRGAEVRFEADQWTTEFGIGRAFSEVEPAQLREALRRLENEQCVFRRHQYVIGYSEPKLVFSLTPTGYARAMELRSASVGGRPDSGPAAPASESPVAPPEPPSGGALSAALRRPSQDPPSP
jgi:DNA-binding PadR family transcriptional regulator